MLSESQEQAYTAQAALDSTTADELKDKAIAEQADRYIIAQAYSAAQDKVKEFEAMDTDAKEAAITAGNAVMDAKAAAAPAGEGEVGP